MVSQLVTITFNSADMARTMAFYNALGANLSLARVNKGAEIYRGHLGNIELVFHSIPVREGGAIPRVSLRFQLVDIDQIWQRLQEIPQVNVVLGLESMPEGRSFIVVDPDGHSIEVFEKWGANQDDSR